MVYIPAKYEQRILMMKFMLIALLLLTTKSVFADETNAKPLTITSYSTNLEVTYSGVSTAFFSVENPFMEESGCLRLVDQERTRLESQGLQFVDADIKSCVWPMPNGGLGGVLILFK